MKRPVLNEIPIDGATILKPGLTVTISIGQWDKLLEAAYDGGATLLESNDNETPVRAFRRKEGAN